MCEIQDISGGGGVRKQSPKREENMLDYLSCWREEIAIDNFNNSGEYINKYMS